MTSTPTANERKGPDWDSMAERSSLSGRRVSKHPSRQ